MAITKEKYKKTELGLLPEDWDAVKIHERYSLNNDPLSDKNPLYKEFYYLDLSSVKDGKIDFPKEKISFEDAPSRARRILKPNNIIMATVRPNLKGFAIADFDTRNFICSTGFALINTYDKKDAHFLFHLINDHIVYTQIENLVTGSSYPSINNSDVANLLIPYPSLKKERDKIADILTSWDKSIQLIEKLIVKKEEQKKGLMQNLLSGKRRFREFKKEKWVKIVLSDVVTNFIVPMRDKPKDLTGNIPWCRIEDFDGKYLSVSKTNQGVTKKVIDAMNLKVYPVNTLLVSCSAYLGICAITKAPLVTNQTFIGLVPGNKIDIEYLYYVVASLEKELNTLSSGTTIAYLSKDAFENIQVTISKNISEQKKIASVLVKADDEIQHLKIHLNTLREKKKGVMQLLLTGKKRVKV